MKLRNTVIALSTAAALAMLTGCAKDDNNDDSSSDSSGYSDSAIKSAVSYYYSGTTGAKLVDLNVSYTYAEEKITKKIVKDHTNAYDDNKLSYRIDIETCSYTTDDDGFAKEEICADSYLYSAAGGAEKRYENLTSDEKTKYIDPVLLAGTKTTYKNTTKFKYNENHYLTEKEETAFNIVTSITTYEKYVAEYVTYTDDIDDPIITTIGTEYNSTDLQGSDTIGFSYNEDGNLAISIQGADSFYVYDGDQIDFISKDLSAFRLEYVDGQFIGFTGTVPNYNNTDLNEYELKDIFLEYVYDGDQVIRKLEDESSFTEYTYEDFDNEIYAFYPLDEILDNTLDYKGVLIYNKF